MAWKRCAAAAVVCASPARALCAISQHSQEEDVSKTDAFLQWLRRNGADVTAFAIQPSRISSPSATQLNTKDNAVQQRVSYGAFFQPSASSNWKSQIMGERVSTPIAAFSQNLVLTIETPFADPIIGGQLQELFEEKEMSPAVILALYILLQRQMGSRSRWQAWIEILPERIHTPLTYLEAELQAINGTPLVRAARHMRHDMLECWKQLQVALHRLTASLGNTHSVAVTLGSVCWIGLNGVPNQDDFLWAIAVVWSRATEIPNAAANGTAPCLGIIPGLDFFNHSAAPNCRWEAVNHEGRLFYEVHPIQRGMRLRRRTELTISYGARSNEELLFLYGFVLDMNPNDTLRIPLKDHNPQGRQEILAYRRAPPFIVLPGGDTLAVIKRNLRQCWREEELMALIPADVKETFEVLCDRHAQVHEGLEKRRNALTSLELIEKLRQLLEVREESLEGTSGTGSLEADIEFLQRFMYGRDSQASWNAVVYRSIQKSLNREWIKIAKIIEERLEKGSQ